MMRHKASFFVFTSSLVSTFKINEFSNKGLDESDVSLSLSFNI